MLKLYRKRFIPDEIVDLKNDRIIYHEGGILITEWDALHPKAKFSHGISCYYMDQGWKISKFLNKKKELVYYYCDIIETSYLEEENAYLFTDLLADVIVYPDGAVEVVDLDELSDALEAGVITIREIKQALRTLDALLKVIYSGGLPKLIHFMEEKV
nr:DUF402 domain-containing protein [uncultured Anaerotignum sp.]